MRNSLLSDEMIVISAIEIYIFAFSCVFLKIKNTFLFGHFFLISKNLSFASYNKHGDVRIFNFNIPVIYASQKLFMLSGLGFYYCIFFEFR